MSPEEFRQVLVVIGVVMAVWAVIMPFLLMLTLYTIGYQHDYELKEPQWTIPGLVEWFFIPRPERKPHEEEFENIWRYQRGHEQATPLSVHASDQDLQLEAEVLQVPPSVAASNDTWARW